MSRDASRPHGVLVLLGDGSEDVVAGRVAAQIARDAGTRILAAVILTSSGPVTDAAGGDLCQRRQDATAVSGRVRPVLEEYDVPFTDSPAASTCGLHLDAVAAAPGAAHPGPAQRRLRRRRPAAATARLGPGNRRADGAARGRRASGRARRAPVT